MSYESRAHDQERFLAQNVERTQVAFEQATAVFHENVRSGDGSLARYSGSHTPAILADAEERHWRAQQRLADHRENVPRALRDAGAWVADATVGAGREIAGSIRDTKDTSPARPFLDAIAAAKNAEWHKKHRADVLEQHKKWGDPYLADELRRASDGLAVARAREAASTREFVLRATPLVFEAAAAMPVGSAGERADRAWEIMLAVCARGAQIVAPRSEALS